MGGTLPVRLDEDRLVSLQPATNEFISMEVSVDFHQ